MQGICNSTVEREERKGGEGGERERFRRVIGSAGVDAILSSIPHQPPPGNLYRPGVLSFSRAHATPSATRDPLEIDTNTKQPLSKIEIDES